MGWSALQAVGRQHGMKVVMGNLVAHLPADGCDKSRALLALLPLGGPPCPYVHGLDGDTNNLPPQNAAGVAVLVTTPRGAHRKMRAAFSSGCCQLAPNPPVAKVVGRGTRVLGRGRKGEGRFRIKWRKASPILST